MDTNASIAESEKTDKPAGTLAPHDSYAKMYNNIKWMNCGPDSLTLRFIGNLFSNRVLISGACEKLIEKFTINLGLSQGQMSFFSDKSEKKDKVRWNFKIDFGGSA